MKNFTLLASVAALATLMALVGAGAASATELYRAGGTVGVNTSFTASLEAGTTLSIASTAEAPIVTCTASELKGKITNSGSSTTTVRIGGEHLTLGGGCSATVFQPANGELLVHHIGSSTNGTLIGTGFFVTVHSPFVGACSYTLRSDHGLGTITGSTSSSATIEINGVMTELEPKRVLCPDTTRWIARYSVTSPTPLYVEAS